MTILERGAECYPLSCTALAMTEVDILLVFSSINFELNVMQRLFFVALSYVGALDITRF